MKESDKTSMNNACEYVAVHVSKIYEYPTVGSLFRPAKQYPEYPFDELSNSNKVYEAVRNCFKILNLDLGNFESADWNPLGKYIKPGDTVLIKPNMVMDSNHITENGTDCLYTNPSVVAPVVDYVWIALKKEGKIIIGDAPMQECDFSKLMDESGYERLVNWYKGKGVNIDIVDFRELTSTIKNGIHLQTINEKASGKIIDLGDESEFSSIDENKASKLRITNYNPDELVKHHNSIINEYYVSDYVIAADVVINMPKPKCHRKAGATIGMKNFVGVNVRKEFLPHHTMGSKEEDGDEYLHKNKYRKIYSQLLDRRNRYMSKRQYARAFVVKALGHIVNKINKQEDYIEGNWYGNNTICKTIIDINKIVKYADKDAVMQEKPTRRVFNIADMIVTGEKEGPVAPSPRKAGMIVMGEDIVCFDETIATLMGFSYKKIPTLNAARNIKGKYILCNGLLPVILSNDKRFDKKRISNIVPEETLQLEPTVGWKGHIEL